ncbi:hypothetical protein ABN763_12090 [Spongiivirga sp. MCCC 1A20706]|uniref:hypothetical protein n=1 Tax=Spongiivirga sp. MCCC 1A20706 TaxID=3160963 RepID=UPI003977CC3B
MKFLKLLFAATLLLFVSCDLDDGNDNPINNNSIAGTWNLVSVEFDGNATTTVQNIPIVTSFDSVSKDENFDCVFEEGPETVSCSGSYTSVLTIRVPSLDDIVEETQVQAPSGSTTYQISGNELVLGNNIFQPDIVDLIEGAQNISFRENKITILNITSQTLVLEITTEGSFDVEGTPSIFNFNSTISFEKAN